mgnify:CR=1 FL=1
MKCVRMQRVYGTINANDVIAADYCGMACNEYGWWYIQNGDVNFTYTGMACNEYAGGILITGSWI